MFRRPLSDQPRTVESADDGHANDVPLLRRDIRVVDAGAQERNGLVRVDRLDAQSLALVVSICKHQVTDPNDSSQMSPAQTIGLTDLTAGIARSGRSARQRLEVLGSAPFEIGLPCVVKGLERSAPL